MNKSQSTAVVSSHVPSFGDHAEPTKFYGDHNYAVEPSSVQDQLEAARLQMSELENLLERGRVQKFGLQRFSSEPKLLKFYTGFESYETLMNFFVCISQHAYSMQTWSQFQRLGGVKMSHSSKLPPVDQLFMFLHKLRLGSLDQELAEKFSVSQSTVSRNTPTWANFLYVILGSQPIWPARDEVQKFMPASIRQLYPNTRVVIDCTEIAVQSPSSLMLNSELFSSYKGRTTLKCLVGVTQSGAVSFISSLYAGSISDKRITKVSGFLD